MTSVLSATSVSSRRARRRLASLYPAIGPWTSAALWHGRRAVAPPTTPLDSEIEEICSQRLASLLLRYARDQQVTLAPPIARRLRAESFAWAVRSNSAALAGRVAIEQLAAMDCPVAVSKGPGIARFYDSVLCRPYSDIDLLVPAHRFANVVAGLEGVGFVEELRNRMPRMYMRRLCREGLNLVRNGTERIDVHHRVPPWIWSSGLDAQRLIDRAETAAVGSVQLPLVSPADNLLIAALHVVSDRNQPGRTLLIWRDLVELASAAKVDDIVSAAEQAGLTGWLSAALLSLPHAFGLEDLMVALDPTAPLAHPRRLAAILSPRTANLGVLATQTLRLPVWNGLAYLAGMTAPSQQYLREMYPETRNVYRAWWTRERHLAYFSERRHPDA